MLRDFILTITLLFSFNTFSQTNYDWEDLINSITSLEDAENESWAENFELWEELAQNPINLNTATKEDLLQLGFLSDEQIEDILLYVYKYSPMLSTDELAMIESIDEDTRQLLQCFVCAELVKKKAFPKLSEMVNYGANTLVFSASIPFFKRKGDKNGYLGYPYRHSFRYTYSYYNKIKFGLVGSQDGGEPFFANKNKYGYDYYSFYVSLSNMGKLKKLVLGRYKTSFGMGLVINNDLSFGKILSLTTLGRKRNNIREHSSRSESNYLQGVASSIEVVKNVTASGFISSRRIDATLTPKEENSIRTILTSGYHRTESEMNRHNNATENLAGGNITYSNNGWQIGTTAVFYNFSLPLKPDTRQIYRQWNATGRNFWNAGIDYGYRHYKFSYQGEVATAKSGGMATINRLTYDPISTLSLVALQRFYSYKYVGLHANSFAEGGKVQNESGVFLGTTWQVLPRFTIQAYADYAYYAWPRYQADWQSKSTEFMFQCSYENSLTNLSARYIYKMREKNNEEKTGLINDASHRARIVFATNYRELQFKSQIDYSFNNYKKTSRGYMISENINWKPLKQLKAFVSAAYFHTDDYASRLYTYEPGLLYQFYFPSYYGEGIHLAAHLRGDISTKLMLIAKIDYTNYFDRDHISSGLQQIDASHQSTLQLQLRWKF